MASKGKSPPKAVAEASRFSGKFPVNDISQEGLPEVSPRHGIIDVMHERFSTAVFNGFNMSDMRSIQSKA